MREKLIKILRVPIFPHELVDPTEAVADYLLDNDVVPVVRCKDCKYQKNRVCAMPYAGMWVGVELKDSDFCSYGERKDNERKAD